MGFVIVLAVVALVVVVGALQNAQATTVSFLFWQFEASLAVVILAAATAGLALGVLVGWGRALRRWRQRPPAQPPDASGRDEALASNPSVRAGGRR